MKADYLGVEFWKCRLYRADRKHEPKNSYICTQENIRKQKMIATTTYHDTYGGSLRSMTMDMMYMRNRFRRV